MWSAIGLHILSPLAVDTIPPHCWRYFPILSHVENLLCLPISKSLMHIEESRSPSTDPGGNHWAPFYGLFSFLSQFLKQAADNPFLPWTSCMWLIYTKIKHGPDLKKKKFLWWCLHFVIKKKIIFIYGDRFIKQKKYNMLFNHRY